jgi:hypothetical protein
MAARTWSGSVSGDWSVTGNWVEGSVPVNGDEVYIPAGSAAITAGLNQSAVTLDWLEIERGYSANIGSKAAYLRVGTAVLIASPTGGSQFIDIGSSAISPEIRSTGTSSDGTRAFNLKGSAIATLSVLGGGVGVGVDPSVTSTITTVRNLGGNVWIGQGVTLTTLYQTTGDAVLDCAVTTVTMFGGTIEKRYAGTLATANLYNGTLYYSGSGGLTTLNAYGGVLDCRRSGIARTIGTLNAYGQKPFNAYIDPAYLTVTTFARPSGVYQATFTQGA